MINIQHEYLLLPVLHTDLTLLDFFPLKANTLTAYFRLGFGLSLPWSRPTIMITMTAYFDIIVNSVPNWLLRLHSLTHRYYSELLKTHVFHELKCLMDVVIQGKRHPFHLAPLLSTTEVDHTY